MASNGGYSIYVEAELNLDKLKKDLQTRGLKLPVTADASGAKEVSKTLEDISNKMEDANSQVSQFGLTWQEASSIMSKCVDIIEKMTDQVFELDTSLTEFKKVSDLSESSLDSYVDKLSDMGKEVARTGKPNRSEPVCCDGKAA